MPKKKTTAAPPDAGVISLSTSTDVGLGSAFQLVAQATAATVVDGSQYLQAVSVVSSTAIAVLTAGMVEQIATEKEPNKPHQYVSGMEAIQKNMQDTAETFEKIGDCAAAVLTAFKSI